MTYVASNSDKNQMDAATQEVTELRAKLMKSEKALEKAKSELQQFAYISSHDLKAPLRAISHLSEWIAEDLKDQLHGETAQNMELLQRRVKNMEKLLDCLLEYSRITSAPSQEEVPWRNIYQLIDSTKKEIAAPETFTVHISDALTYLYLPDRPWLTVFSCLIRNAIEHHHVVDGNLWIDVEENTDIIILSFKDDGPGIPAQHQKRIFRMFQTLKTNSDVEHYGLGLALVHKAVLIHCGHIEVQSEQGAGTTMRIYLPLSTVRKDQVPSHG